MTPVWSLAAAVAAPAIRKPAGALARWKSVMLPVLPPQAQLDEEVAQIADQTTGLIVACRPNLLLQVMWVECLSFTCKSSSQAHAIQLKTFGNNQSGSPESRGGQTDAGVVLAPIGDFACQTRMGSRRQAF